MQYTYKLFDSAIANISFRRNNTLLHTPECQPGSEHS